MKKPYKIPAGFSEKTSPKALFAELMLAYRATLDGLEQEALLADEKALLAQEKTALEHENALLKQKLFGTSSEKRHLKKDKALAQEPMSLVFDEAVPDGTADEDLSDENGVFDETTALVRSNTFSHKENKPKKGRKPLPSHFPREQVIHDLPEHQKVCACGCHLSKIGEEVSEQLEVIPAELKVIRHIRYKYACKACEEGVRIVPLPAQPIPKGIPAAGLLAHVCVAKYDDHLPLYRQSEIWARMGVELSRATLSSWVLSIGDRLSPLIPLLRAHMIQTGYIRADESPTQVLREPGRIPTAQSYMWLYMTGSHPNTAIVYDYQETRKGEHAKTFLTGFKGTLQTDGYSGYSSVTSSEDVAAAGCFAHARRKFYDVWNVTKKRRCSLKSA